jgi:hypothetical protein
VLLLLLLFSHAVGSTAAFLRIWLPLQLLLHLLPRRTLLAHAAAAAAAAASASFWLAF